jgi:hypothetical protein
MANTINAYDADVRIPQFLGLKQYGDLMNGNPVYADHAANMNTKGGTLMPMAAPKIMDGEIEYKIETLMRGTQRISGEEIIVAAAGRRMYVYRDTMGEWEQIPYDDLFSTNVWSWVNYEYTPDGERVPHDMILFSNAEDGLYMLDLQELAITPIQTKYRFGIIERSHERIWGAACKTLDGDSEPDLLVYSAPYDPQDWKARVPVPDPEDPWQEEGEPEDGAGEIREPSWDGDAFMALKSFGDQLIAFKRTRVWRVIGTDPGVYEFKEQFGGGAITAETVAVDAHRIYMLGRDGIMAYDGNAVEPFGKEYAFDVWRRINRRFVNLARACLWKDKYYIAVPLDDEEENHAVVTYDLHDGTWNLRNDLAVESWLPCETSLYFTSSDNPFGIREYREDCWETGEATDAEQFWISPWNDLGYPHKSKGPFQFYFTPEVQDKPTEFTVTLETDKRSRSKTVIVYPITGYEQRMNYEAKTIRIPFAGSGRRFRITIAAKGGSAWRICGGVVLRVDQETEG